MGKVIDRIEGDGFRLHRLRFAGRHRNGRADGRLLCRRRAASSPTPEVSSVRDSDRILGILAAKSKRAVEGDEPVKEFLLLTRCNPKRVSEGEMLSLTDIERHSAHQADRRHSRIRIRPPGVQPGPAGDPSERYRRRGGVQGCGGPLSRRGAFAAFTDYAKPNSLKRIFGGK